jgi:hypothetical protein
MRRTKKELEQLLADALADRADAWADRERQANTIGALDSSNRELLATVQDLRRALETALVENYRGIEGARRWLADHIGYDLRQVAKCPTCLGTSTAPTNPEEIGAEFCCRGCGQVFYIVKVLDTSAATIRRAVKERQYASVVDVKVESSTPASRFPQLPSGQK